MERDVLKATELSLTIKRNQVRGGNFVLSTAELIETNARLQEQLKQIQAKYRPGGALAAFSSEFEQRVKSAVEAGTDEAKWIKEAKVEYAAKMGGPPVDLGFLSQMPDTNRVYADIRGTNEPDTKARQRGAFVQLINIIHVLTDNELGRKPQSDAELALLSTYATAHDHTSSREWTGLMMYRYETDEALQKDLVTRYLSPAWQAKFASMKAEQDGRRAQYAKQREAEEQKAQEAARQAGRQSRLQELTGFWGPLIGMALLVIYVILYVLGAKFAWNRKLEIVENPAPILRIGSHEYQLHGTTGTVLEQSRDISTHTVVSGGYNDQPLQRRSVTVEHREFFLRTDAGEEKSFRFGGPLGKVPMLPGHRVSVVWVVRAGHSTGPYVMLKNQSTREVAFTQLHKMGAAISPRHVPLIVLSFLGCIVGIVAYSLIAWTASTSAAKQLGVLLEQKALPLLDPPAQATGTIPAPPRISG